MMKLHQLLGVRELNLTHDGLESKLARVQMLCTFDLDGSSFGRFGRKPVDAHWAIIICRGMLLRYIKLSGRSLLVDGYNARGPVA
jgi:hypothetical protein